MNLLTPEGLVEFCLGLPGAWADNPWDHDYPVIKVGPHTRGKIFAFFGADSVGIKAGATREIADEWLHRYPADASVMAYLGRSGWNNLRWGGDISNEEIFEAVQESYDRVVAGLPMKARPVGGHA